MLFGHISAWVPDAAATEVLCISAFVTCTGTFDREQTPRVVELALGEPKAGECLLPLQALALSAGADGLQILTAMVCYC